MGSLVSLVMTDIVGSTQRWNAAEGAMAADLELHDRVIRDVVDGAGGNVFKHTGDGMIAVFDDPVAAVGAAAAIQRTIGDTVWEHPDGLHVRAAVHTGVVYPRDGDLFGTAVNKVARILSACPPGAVLVSNATAGLLTDRAPEGLTLESIGPLTLSGFTTPEHAHAVVGPGLAAHSPIRESIRSDPPTGTLPTVDDELIGRADELAAIWDAIGQSRLVTLTGVGGMGKTRLALEVAAGATGGFSNGAWWIDLSSATSPEAVVPVAMAAVGAREAPGRSPVEAFSDHFIGMSAVLVIDNCEHVLSAARDLVAAVRSTAPDVRVVCTSREALGIRGEQIVPVGSLPTIDGVDLFIDRALAVRPDLDIETDRPVIERLCVRLDGIPLAIELAAARCRSITPAEIETRLDDRFRLLRGGRSGAERHRTLQAAVAWSYSLLDADEREVFDQMAVFAGGTLIDGLAAVCNLDEYDAIDVIDRLVARSMVVATRTPLGSRYHQLETLRQFAEDRLVEAEAIGRARERHLEWVSHLAHAIRSQTGTPGAERAFARFSTDLDNLRVGVAHAVTTGNHRVAHQIVADITLFAADRPAWEVAEWVHPLHLDDGWTPDAAVCAALRAHIIEDRDGQQGARVPIGDVPRALLASRPEVAWFQLANLVYNGAWAEAIDMFDEVRPDDEAGLCTVTCGLVFALVMRRGKGVPEPDRPDEAVEVAFHNLARAQRLGDLHLIAHTSFFASYALLDLDPLPAIDYARAGVTAAEQIGARYLVERAGAIHMMALSSAAAAGLLPVAEVAPQLKAALIDAFDKHHMFLASTIMRGATRFLCVYDRPAAAVLEQALTRLTGMSIPAVVRRRLDADPLLDRTAISAQASSMTLEDAMVLTIAALDRVIAAGGVG